MFQYLNYLKSIIESNYFILFASIFSFILKSLILLFLFSKGLKSDKKYKSWVLILLVLISSMMSDSAWILAISKQLFFPQIRYGLYFFYLNICWVFYIIQYQSLALFMDDISKTNNNISFHQKIFLAISSILASLFIFFGIYNLKLVESSTRFQAVLNLQTITTLYLLIPLMLSSLFFLIRKIKKDLLPRILKKQIKTLIAFIILPLIVADIIQYYPFTFVLTKIGNILTFIGISNLFVAYAIFYCMRKIMGLRFLNLDNHVKSSKKFDFIQDFKNIIDQLGQATSIKELGFISQHFFQEAFNIPTRRLHFYIRNFDKPKKLDNEFEFDHDKEKVENFINNQNFDNKILKFLHSSKVVIADEIEFSNFYENDPTRENIVNFMKEISADIFMPIFEKKKIIAYIIIERHARTSTKNKNNYFYSDLEHDQMAIFSTYLGNIIKILKSKNLNVLIKEKKELKEELYLKHQEVSQYKESLKSFLKNSQKKTGLIFYKNRRFTFGNQAAYELIPIKLNTYSGHPITKKLKNLASQVLEYNTSQSCILNNRNGEKLVASGILHVDKNSVIITVNYPEVSDVIKDKIGLIKNPTKFDYLLYLETTKSGKLIDKLIPGNSETLLNLKIDLLEIALSNNAILLDLPESDLMPTVEILHHISLRENLHILDLKKPSQNCDTAIKLFGINKIFGMDDNNEKPLLEKLDNTGTLFIKNINHLELETQKHLAEFIKYGFYRQFKGDRKTFSNVRTICSTNVELKPLVDEGKFCPELFHQLSKSLFSMPSLMTLPEEDLNIVTTEITQRIVKTDELSHFFELTDKEKKKVTQSRPVSFSELKTKIQTILANKSKQDKIHEEIQITSSYETSDPEIIEAARLGKHALRDKKIMCLLWNKFKNQNKIANLLGVNRSSVNRRCKEYNLI